MNLHELERIYGRPTADQCINPQCAVVLGTFAVCGFHSPTLTTFCARCAALLVWCAPRKGRPS